MTYNPNSPAVLGLEWGPIKTGTISLDTTRPSTAWRQTHTVAEAIGGIVIPAQQVGTPANNNLFGLEIYPDGVFPSQTISTLVVRPTADVINVNTAWWNGAANSLVNTFNGVNNATQSPVALPGGAGLTGDNEFIYTPNGRAYETTYNYTNVSATLAGKQILRVRQVAVLAPYSLVTTSGGLNPTMTARPIWNQTPINVRTYGPNTYTVAGGTAGGVQVSYEWLYNPIYRDFWQSAQLADLAAGTSIGWQVRATNSTTRVATILQEWIEIDYVPEVRVAMAPINFATVGVGTTANPTAWTWCTLHNSANAGVWNKTAGTYRYEFRQLDRPAQTVRTSLKTMFGPNQTTTLGLPQSQQLLNLGYAPTNLPSSATPVDDGNAYGLGIQLTVGSSFPNPESADSQPYQTYHYPTDANNFNNGSWWQRITTPASVAPGTAYQNVRFWVRLNSTAKLASGSRIDVAMYNAGGAQISSIATLTDNDFYALTDGTNGDRRNWHEVELTFTSPAILTPSTLYTLRFTQTGGTLANGWDLMAIKRITKNPVNAGNANHNGATDYLLTQNGAASDTGVDMAAHVFTEPAVPPNFTVSTVTLNECLETIEIHWTNPGGTGDGYELQRSDVSPDGPWDTIAIMTGLSATTFFDSETFVNTPSYYRARTTRSADSSFSNWTTVMSATATMSCCGYVLSSNVDPDFLVWADDVGDTSRNTDYPQNVELRQFYNRDYQVAFHEKEFRGARFKRTLLIAADNALDGTLPTTTPGQQTFFNELFGMTRPDGIPTPLPSSRTLPTNRTMFPYVCVVDQNNRWFATVLTPSVEVTDMPGWYKADVEFIETTNVPYVVVTDGCTQGGPAVDVYLQETTLCSLLTETGDYLMVDV